MGVQADEAQRMGERVARFQAAADHLDAASKHSKTLESGIVDRSAVGDALVFANGERKPLYFNFRKCTLKNLSSFPPQT